jgi:hypothetical protein
MDNAPQSDEPSARVESNPPEAARARNCRPRGSYCSRAMRSAMHSVLRFVCVGRDAFSADELLALPGPPSKVGTTSPQPSAHLVFVDQAPKEVQQRRRMLFSEFSAVGKVWLRARDGARVQASEGRGPLLQ